MNGRLERPVRSAVTWLAGGAALAAAGYAAYVGVTWSRYGKSKKPAGPEVDPLLDRFMPEYEAVDRHEARMPAPAEVVLAAASEMNVQRSWIARAIFSARQAILGGAPQGPAAEGGIVEVTKSLGWGVLAEIPGREIVMGAVTRPWEREVVFRAVPADEFAAFDEPGYVKIAWTLRADPMGEGGSIFRTETRVAATDEAARARFRWYWAFFSPGIWLIRYLTLGPLRAEAARRVQPEMARISA
jgi:hypothetical protein